MLQDTCVAVHPQRPGCLLEGAYMFAEPTERFGDSYRGMYLWAVVWVFVRVFVRVSAPHVTAINVTAPGDLPGVAFAPPPLPPPWNLAKACQGTRGKVKALVVVCACSPGQADGISATAQNLRALSHPALRLWPFNC